MSKRLVYLILISSLIRIILASVLELSNDEVYYYLYALDLQSNYFDHPPGVGWLIRIFTFNLNLNWELFVRLGAIVCAALATGLVYRLGTMIKNERTGWFAAVLYTTGIYTSLIVGTFIIPDSPQVVCWLASLVLMYKIVSRTDRQEEVTISQWILFGASTGLCILCKVHGIFLWFGFGLYILAYQRQLLTKGGLYLSAIVTLTFISPIIWWNIQNDFITYRFHSERVAVKETLFHFDYFFQTLAGQLLYNNPVNAVLILISLWRLSSTKYLTTTSIRFIMFNGLPIILMVTGMALFNPILPHWSGPGFLVLIFLSAAWLDGERKNESFDLPRSVKAGGTLILSAILLAALLINYYPGTLGSRERSRYGDGDFTLDMYGWRQFSNDFSSWLKDEKQTGRIPEDITIVSDRWFPAAHLDYYVAAPLQMTVVGVGQVTDLHQYYWLNKNRSNPVMGGSALCIVPTNNPREMQTSFLQYFSSATLLKSFENKRGGKVVRYFDVYRLDGYLMNDEMHQ